jgi:hypothetical protein
VKSRCRKVECPGGKGRSPSDTRNKRGEIFTDYYFGEANTPNKSDNHHNNAINENLNWGGFPGCYSSLPPTVDLVPRSRTIPGGKGRGGEARDDEELNTINKELDSMSTMNSGRELPQRNDNVKRRGHRDFKRRNDSSTDDRKRSIITRSGEDTRQKDGSQRTTKMLTEVRRTKGTTGIPNRDIGIKTIRCKQGIVMVPILHTLEILKFEGIRREENTYGTCPDQSKGKE